MAKKTAKAEEQAYNLRLTKLLVDLSVDPDLRNTFDDPETAEAAMKARGLDEESIAAVLSGKSARVRKALGYLQFGFGGESSGGGKKAAKKR